MYHFSLLAHAVLYTTSPHEKSLDGGALLLQGVSREEGSVDNSHSACPHGAGTCISPLFFFLAAVSYMITRRRVVAWHWLETR